MFLYTKERILFTLFVNINKHLAPVLTSAEFVSVYKPVRYGILHQGNPSSTTSL